MSHPYPHVSITPEEYSGPSPRYTTSLEQCGPPPDNQTPSGRTFCNGEISQPNGSGAQNIINNINRSQQ
jgi:hypothetical protein